MSNIDNNNNTTPFSVIYDSFLSKITDDMYMELTEWDTERMLEELLISAIPKFEFPRVNLNDYELEYVESETKYQGVDSDNIEVTAFFLGGGCFNCELSSEEINILATYMIVEWVGQQLASVENTRMKYSGSDFKFTSQANHMQKLLLMKKDYEREGFHLQRLYKRRIVDSEGNIRSTFYKITSPLDAEGWDVLVEIKYNIEINDIDVKNNLKRLTNQIYKLLPVREENEDWKTPLITIIEEIGGMSRLLIGHQETLFSLLCKLEGLFILDKQDDFYSYRRTIFECLSIVNSIIKTCH